MTDPTTTAAGSDVPHDAGPAALPRVQVEPPWPLDPDDVAAWLQLTDLTDADTATLELVSAAATAYTQRCRYDLVQLDPETGAGTFVPDAEAYQGAVMYAAREYRRRNTPSGLQNFGDAGVSYVARWDSDIDRCLRTGQFTRPGVG